MNARSLWNLRAALAFAAGASLIPSAVAQQAAPQEQPAEESVKLEKFEVTGSRIPRTEVEGPSPIRVITRADIEMTGRSNVGELLRELPEASAIGINEAGTITAVRGATALDLRQLGANNTLVIVNGRRVVLSGTNSGGTTFVDLNRFPVAMIERIEVLKDGASAIYGADATAGVVNIITRRDFNGFEVNMSYGNTFDTDVAEKTFSIFGGAASGKMTATVGLSYFERNALRAVDTNFANQADLTARFIATGHPTAIAYAGLGYYDGRSGTGPQARISRRSSGGLIAGTGTDNPNWATATAAQQALVNGRITPSNPFGLATDTFLPGTNGKTTVNPYTNPFGQLASATPSFTSPYALGTGGVFNGAAAASYEAQRLTPGQAVSNLYNFQPFVWLVPSAERTGMSADFKYALTPETEIYFGVQYQHNESETQLAPSPISTGGDNQIYVPASNYWNPFGVDLNFFYRPTQIGPRIANITTDTYSFLMGVKGKLLDRFDWDVGYTYGKDTTTDVTTNAMSESRVRAALARTDSTALNIFGGPDFVNNPATIDGIRVTTQKGGNAELNLFDAKLAGTVLELPTGDLGAAVYAEYREEYFVEANDAISTTLDDIIGQVRLADATSAYRNVMSVAAEMSAPLVKAKSVPLIYSLEATVAARFEKFSDGYDSGVKPYFGIRYQPIADLVLRGSYTESFRAPTLPQLFGGVRESLPSSLPDFARPQVLTGDPFDGSSTQRLVRAGGNPNLEPETSKSHQFGFVYEVPLELLKGLELEFTYGQIEQENIITTTGTTFLRNNEFGDAAGLIVRDPGTETYTNTTASPITVYTGPGARGSAGADVVVQPGQSITVPGRIRYLSDSYVNLAYQRVRYYDFGIRYDKKTTNYGRFVASSNATLLDSYSFTRTPGGALTNFVGRDGYPEYRIQTRLDWAWKNYGASIANNYTPSYGDWDLDGIRTTPYSVYNVSFNYEVPASVKALGGVRVTIGLDNVFDKEPPLYWDSIGYDASMIGRPQGRFGYIALRKSL